MNFGEYPISSFPKGAQYYFGVTLLNIGTRERCFEAPSSMIIEEVWDVSELTAPIPRAIHWYLSDNNKEDIINNVVIEIHNGEISWYTTKDSD